MVIKITRGKLGGWNRGGKFKWDGRGKFVRESCKLNYEIFCTNDQIL